ncbi:MAG TPA: hypothetical protein VNJ01_05975 [Bacteriovoracaceae bacterium]|nr:hypothetical protein [Bacteriovoracaceae bacterium]
MMSQKLLLLSGLAVSLSSYADYKVDKSEDLNGIHLKSGKEHSVRLFWGTTAKTLPYPMTLVKKGITNFTDKCNNAYKNKRKFTPTSYDCKYHNATVIESFVEKQISPAAGSESYLVGKKIYNLGASGYYELVEVKDGVNKKNQKTITITQRMLDNKEVKSFVTPKFENNSDFDKKTIVLTLTEASPKETHLSYQYEAETDHWVLNKQVNVPQIFASITKNIKETINVIDQEASEQSREVASK